MYKCEHGNLYKDLCIRAYMYMYVRICVYLYVCVYVYVYVYMCTCIYGGLRGLYMVGRKWRIREGRREHRGEVSFVSLPLLFSFISFDHFLSSSLSFLHEQRSTGEEEDEREKEMRENALPSFFSLCVCVCSYRIMRSIPLRLAPTSSHTNRSLH